MKKNDLSIRDEILDWLPERLFDFHVHVGLPSHHASLSDSRKRTAMAASQYFDQSIKRTENKFIRFLPGKNIDYVCFPFPFKELDAYKANEYILTAKNPFVVSNLSNTNEVMNYLQMNKVKGLKVYYDFLDKPYSEIEINDFCPSELLEILNTNRKILMLHVPKKSLNDASNLKQLQEMSEKYPYCTIMLAHMGRCHEPDDLSASLDVLKEYPNICLDTSTICETKVYEVAIEKIGSERIFYGSDSPYSYIRGKTFNVPGPMGKAFITEEVYPWTLPKLREWYLRNKPGLTFLIYHQLKGMKEAMENLSLSKEEIENIFSKNAQRLLHD